VLFKIIGSAILLAAISGAAMAINIDPVPEIDPASAYSGLTLLAGALLVLRGHRAKK
jgi:hypothetical protein